MTDQAPAIEGSASVSERGSMGHLLWFFALVYVVEGLGQIGGLIAQPLNYYLKQVQGWTPLQITAYLTLFNLPWIIKPLYGLVSDFIPLFGYRRKSYLLIANAAATCGFLLVTQLTVPDRLVFALMLTAYAMAISCVSHKLEKSSNVHSGHETYVRRIIEHISATPPMDHRGFYISLLFQSVIEHSSVLHHD